nr:hypothetical protein GCM10020093_049300 [Planobispora longispora]
MTDEALAALAGLLRRFHDAAATFRPPRHAVWENGSNDDLAPELVGHCDVNLDNVVFRDGLPYALIDFDLARPTTRLFDVVTTLRHWAPLADPVDLDPVQRELEPGPRLRLFCDAYGLRPRDRRRLLDLARLRFSRSYVAMRARAATGGGWARMWAEGRARASAGPERGSTPTMMNFMPIWSRKAWSRKAWSRRVPTEERPQR